MLLLLLASGLRGEKAFENALCLPLRGILEINPHVHTARATERGIKSLDVVCGGKQKTKAEDMKLIHEGDGISETHRPSAAATPSRELRRPLRLNVDPSLFSSLFFALDVLDEVEEEEVPVGAPVDFSSREMPRVNAASKSSRSRIHLGRNRSATNREHTSMGITHLEGTLPIRFARVLSLILCRVK